MTITKTNLNSTVTPPLLDNGNYFEVEISNNTTHNGGGETSDNIFVSMVSQTHAYKFEQYINANGKTVYVATVDTPTGGSVASISLSTLVNQINNNTLGFYVQVFDGSPLGIAGGRIYFANENNAVPYSAKGPGGIAPNASFVYDFVEFTVDSAKIQLNLDTTQVDQFGIPIYLQVNPIVPDFKDGTGIVSSQTRAGVIQDFKNYTAKHSDFTAYQGIYKDATVDRLLAPQHVIDGKPASEQTKGLRKAYDQALYNLFNHYYNGSGGGGHHLYLVGNGSSGPEIFDGQVITNFKVKDTSGTHKGSYTVFQFTGTGYTYNGTGNTLTNVGSRGGAVYEIFYPYFSNNDPNTFNTALSSSFLPPKWFGNSEGDLPITSAGRMVFGASGVFADDVQQKKYYKNNGGLPANFDHVMLGNLENQLVTLLNRGITPDTGNSTAKNNLHLRTGSNTENDLIHVDLSQKNNTSTAAIAPNLHLSQGAATTYAQSDLLTAANLSSSDAILWNTLSGAIYFKGAKIQTFNANMNNIADSFTVSVVTGSPANSVTSANFVIVNGDVKQVNFNWQSAVNIPAGATVEFSFYYGPSTTEAHYATLHLFSPYSQSTFAFNSGDLGPESDFSNNLNEASSPTEPTSGMTLNSVGLSNPTYVYNVTANNPSIIIYSPQAMLPINTNIITFAVFYPLDANNIPLGEWNAYSAFFHIGDPAHSVLPPTVDGKGYAFAFDDNGGYSSDITVNLPTTNSGNVDVVTTLKMDFLPWKA